MGYINTLQTQPCFVIGSSVYSCYRAVSAAGQWLGNLAVTVLGAGQCARYLKGAYGLVVGEQVATPERKPLTVRAMATAEPTPVASQANNDTQVSTGIATYKESDCRTDTLAFWSKGHHSVYVEYHDPVRDRVIRTPKRHYKGMFTEQQVTRLVDRWNDSFTRLFAGAYKEYATATICQMTKEDGSVYFCLDVPRIETENNQGQEGLAQVKSAVEQVLDFELFRHE